MVTPLPSGQASVGPGGAQGLGGCPAGTPRLSLWGISGVLLLLDDSWCGALEYLSVMGTSDS